MMRVTMMVVWWVTLPRLTGGSRKQPAKRVTKRCQNSFSHTAAAAAVDSRVIWKYFRVELLQSQYPPQSARGTRGNNNDEWWLKMRSTSGSFVSKMCTSIIDFHNMVRFFELQPPGSFGLPCVDAQTARHPTNAFQQAGRFFRRTY